jgi:hypothetical protein
MTRCTNTKVIVKSVGVQQIMIARRNNHMRPPLVFVNLPIGLITSGHMPSLIGNNYEVYKHDTSDVIDG